MRFVAIGAGESTVVRAAKASGGEVAMSQTIAGSFGVPMMTQNGPGGGMFRDGSTFVLQSIGLEPTTQFALLSTQDLSTRDRISLEREHSASTRSRRTGRCSI